jgi:hypothetical protein
MVRSQGIFVITTHVGMVVEGGVEAIEELSWRCRGGVERMEELGQKKVGRMERVRGKKKSGAWVKRATLINVPNVTNRQTLPP